MCMNLNYLFEDPPTSHDWKPAYCQAINIISHGSHLTGQIYMPEGYYSKPRPCVCLFHGFPGFTNNDDLAHALRRAGCVVIRVHQRGVWSSEGYYSFTNNIEDAIEVANWAISPAAADLQIDPTKVFFCGHSMGGQTTLNATRQLPWIKGTILMAPYNMAFTFRDNKLHLFEALIAAGSPVLNLESETSLFENAAANWQKTDFNTAFEDLKDRNLFFIEGSQDTLASYEDNVQGLWEQLAAHPTDANQKLEILDANHAFCSKRIALCRMIAEWISALCE